MKVIQKSMRLRVVIPRVSKKMIAYKKGLTLAKFSVAALVISIVLNQITGVSIWIPLSLIAFYGSIFYLIFKIENNGSRFMP